MKPKQNTKRGFSFIETLVGITILVFGITAPLTIAFQTIRASIVARDQVVGFYLAQEGIEYARYVRDSNVLTSLFTSPPATDWLRELRNCTSADPCQIDDVLKQVNDAGNVMSNCGGACGFVRYNTATNRFGSSGDDTIYQRSIEVNELIPGEEAEITVRVSWTPAVGSARDIVLRERIFDWTGFSQFVPPPPPPPPSNTVAVDMRFDMFAFNVFTFYITNNSDSATITSIDFSLTGGKRFDYFGGGATFPTVASVGANNDGIRNANVTVVFNGAGLSAGASDSNVAPGDDGDIDNNTAMSGVNVIVHFSDGSTLSGPMNLSGSSWLFSDSS